MVLAFLFFSCAGKQQQVAALPTKQTVEVVAVLDHLDTRESVLCPEDIQQDIKKLLDKRNMEVQFVTSLEPSFTTQRRSDQRIKAISKRPLLLVETQAQFYAQLNGRFRWEVFVKLHIVGENDEILSREFEVPIFHQFHHQREKEAIIEAKPVILRKLNALVEAYVRGGLN